MAGCTRGTYAADAAKIRVDALLAAAIEEISQENQRIESLTQRRRNYYSAASARWELLPVWKSTGASGAPDNSSLSHFPAMTRPCWLGRAVRNRHRHAIEQASRR